MAVPGARDHEVSGLLVTKSPLWMLRVGCVYLIRVVSVDTYLWGSGSRIAGQKFSLFSNFLLSECGVKTNQVVKLLKVTSSSFEFNKQ